MMIFSRVWYLILGILLAAAYYIVALAVGQYNRTTQVALDDALKADGQAVSYAMQVDARRRLDALFLAAVDPGVTKALHAATGKDPIPPTSRDEAVKALRAYNDKLPPDYKHDILFAVDRDGRLVGQVGFDAVNGSPDFELGGYPAVFDALHGFVRDDTWVWGGRAARVVVRPVEDDVTQPPVGAVVAMRWIDNNFAKEMGKRTRTNIAFFALGQRVAAAGSVEPFREVLLDVVASDYKFVQDDKQFKETGRSDVRPLTGEPKAGALYMRLPGDGWDLGVSFAVTRERMVIASPLGFIEGADDQDKKNVKLWIVLALALGGAIVGLFFSHLEHSMPLAEMKRQGERLKKGDIDVFSVPNFRGAYRAIAADINAGISRVVEKGGGMARKPADLESILGPVPAQPNMSAFSFPMADGSMGPQPPSSAMQPPGFPNAPPPPSGANRFPGAPPGAPGAPGSPAAPPPPHSQGNLGPPAPPAPPTRPGPGVAPQERTLSMGGAPPPPYAMPPGPPPPQRPPAPNGPPPKLSKEDEETMVAKPPPDLIAATGQTAAANDPTAEWHKVYEEFIRTKRECGEPTEGLTFEKFQQTLKKNRDALMQRHGCKRVKFSVYVKEGRASLKATPVRE